MLFDKKRLLKWGMTLGLVGAVAGYVAHDKIKKSKEITVNQTQPVDLSELLATGKYVLVGSKELTEKNDEYLSFVYPNLKRATKQIDEQSGDRVKRVNIEKITRQHMVDLLDAASSRAEVLSAQRCIDDFFDFYGISSVQKSQFSIIAPKNESDFHKIYSNRPLFIVNDLIINYIANARLNMIDSHVKDELMTIEFQNGRAGENSGKVEFTCNKHDCLPTLTKEKYALVAVKNDIPVVSYLAEQLHETLLKSATPCFKGVKVGDSNEVIVKKVTDCTDENEGIVHALAYAWAEDRAGVFGISKEELEKSKRNLLNDKVYVRVPVYSEKIKESGPNAVIKEYISQYK